MKLKERIEADFITAFKAKDANAKAALSSIKAKITEAEKANPAFIATDDEVVKIINKAIKQREESIKMYETAGRQELVQKEADEAAVLRNYMPAQMTAQEIADALTGILNHLSETVKNPQALQGKTIGEFNKQYQGRADIGTVKSILTDLIEL
jgi:uncharacterized protein YqeY